MARVKVCFLLHAVDENKKQDSVEALVEFRHATSFVDECCTQHSCHRDKILIPCACHGETVRLTGDTVFAVWPQDGSVKADGFCY